MRFWLFFLSNAFLAAVAFSQMTTKTDEEARKSAAGANLPFFTVFVSDINTNLAAYNSFMESNNMKLPQAVADYYFHVIRLSQTADLEKDVASSFPFTQFKTFITKFPWYDSLLQRASVSTLYVPQDFVSSATAGAQLGTSTSKVSTTYSGTAETALDSSNAAPGVNKGHITLLLVICGFIL